MDRYEISLIRMSFGVICRVCSVPNIGYVVRQYFFTVMNSIFDKFVYSKILSSAMQCLYVT